MKTQPVRPARIVFDDGVPLAPEFGDVYHARAGALAQAQHVFLRGNGLPARWRGRTRFVVLETGFGLGNNFLATWAAWRDDPARCGRLVFVSVDKHPPVRADLERAHAASALAPLAQQLTRSWPALTPNLHTLDFEGGALRLMLAFGDVADWLPELVLEADAFYLDGFLPARNPQMWEPRLFKALARVAAPGATAATWSVARSVRDGLRQAGFDVQRAPGFGGKAEMCVARYAPAFQPRRAPSRHSASMPQARHAVVIGAGLAGAFAALALQREGIACTVIERHRSAAAETSGNPAGLFHGVVTPEDGAHARFNRAAALHAQQCFAPLLGAGLVRGAIDGALRLHPASEPAAMQLLLERQGLPSNYVQALAPAEASALAGVTLGAPAWFYPGGGWLAPAALVRHLLGEIDGLRLGCEVQALRREGAHWQVVGTDGRVVAEAPVVVLANAGDALRLLGKPVWPLQAVRGQVTLLRTPLSLRRPVAGAGYAIDLGDGTLLCGATQQPGDDEPAPREADHAANLRQLERLIGQPLPAHDAPAGRVGWRWVANDRLPVLGPVPCPATGAARLDQPRFVPRQPGLWVLTGLGSRGITWSPLGARVLAAWVAGSPLPLEGGLLDAVDAGRFTSRAARHAAR